MPPIKFRERLTKFMISISLSDPKTLKEVNFDKESKSDFLFIYLFFIFYLFLFIFS